MIEHNILQKFNILHIVADTKPVSFEHNKSVEYEFIVKNKNLVLRKNGIYFGWYIMMLFDYVSASVFIKSENHFLSVLKEMKVKFNKPCETKSCKVVAKVNSIDQIYWNTTVELFDENNQLCATGETIFVDLKKKNENT